MAQAVKQRAEWTASRPGGDIRENDDAVMGIALHWPGTTTNKLGVATDDQVKEWLNNWRDYHVDVRGWSDIGYNLAADQDGRLWILRGVERIGAHAASETNQDANVEWVGILLMLGDQERPSSDMIQAVRWARKNLVLTRYPKAKRVLGHGDVPGAQTACPGPYVREIISMFDDEPNTEEGGSEVTAGQLWGYVNDEFGKEDAYARLRSAQADAKAAREAAENSNRQLHSIASGLSMLTAAMIDGTVDITELKKVNAELSGLGGPGLTHGDPTPETKVTEPVKATAKKAAPPVVKKEGSK